MFTRYNPLADHHLNMNGNDKKTLHFERAHQTILATIYRLPAEIVVLNAAAQRITSSDVLAVTPQPSFDESTRDGYVIGVIGGSEERGRLYRIVDEIPAGKPIGNTLEPDTACRIMTGGCVPEGSARVVPYENCVEQNGTVFIEDSSLQVRATFIRKMGSEIAEGEKLVGTGVALQGGERFMPEKGAGVFAVSGQSKTK